MGPAEELKTKPTQHSVRELRSIGIQPDAIVCRSDRPISPVPQAQDLAALRRQRPTRSSPRSTADSIYEIPLVTHATRASTSS